MKRTPAPPDNEDRHAAMWEAIRQLYDLGPQTTPQLLKRCTSWAHCRPSTKHVYMLAALKECVDLGLVDVRFFEAGDLPAHYVTERGAHDLFDLDAKLEKRS